MTRFQGDWNKSKNILFAQFWITKWPDFKGIETLLMFPLFQPFLNYKMTRFQGDWNQLLHACFHNVLELQNDPISRGLKLSFFHLFDLWNFNYKMTRFQGDWNFSSLAVISFVNKLQNDPISRGLKRSIFLC